MAVGTLSCINAMMFHGQPQFTIKAEKNRAFKNLYLLASFDIQSGNIADCLEHCLENCGCQSFQICGDTKCQLCSSHTEDNRLLLYKRDGCTYATYELRHLTETFPVKINAYYFESRNIFYLVRIAQDETCNSDLANLELKCSEIRTYQACVCSYF